MLFELLKETFNILLTVGLFAFVLAVIIATIRR